MARTQQPAPFLRRPTRRHRSSLRQLDRRALERAGWRTTLEFKENHVRMNNGRLVEVETVWVAEAEREGDTIIAAARSESRAWARLWEQASARGREISAFSSVRASA
jgi:hypothetical protein